MIINDIDTFNYIEAYDDWNYSNAYWIGLTGGLGFECNHSECDGKLTWADGSSFSFLDTSLKAYGGSVNEDCWVFYRSNAEPSTSMMWDSPCGSGLPYICEIPC